MGSCWRLLHSAGLFGYDVVSFVRVYFRLLRCMHGSLWRQKDSFMCASGDENFVASALHPLNDSARLVRIDNYNVLATS